MSSIGKKCQFSFCSFSYQLSYLLHEKILLLTRRIAREENIVAYDLLKVQEKSQKIPA